MKDRKKTTSELASEILKWILIKEKRGRTHGRFLKMIDDLQTQNTKPIINTEEFYLFLKFKTTIIKPENLNIGL